MMNMGVDSQQWIISWNTTKDGVRINEDIMEIKII